MVLLKIEDKVELDRVQWAVAASLAAYARNLRIQWTQKEWTALAPDVQITVYDLPSLENAGTVELDKLNPYKGDK